MIDYHMQYYSDRFNGFFVMLGRRLWASLFFVNFKIMNIAASIFALAEASLLF
jgi:hypothetical protein